MLCWLYNSQFYGWKYCKRWFTFFCGFNVGSIFILTVLSLLYDHSLPSLRSEQKSKTADSTVSNLHIYIRRRILFERHDSLLDKVCKWLLYVHVMWHYGSCSIHGLIKWIYRLTMLQIDTVSEMAVAVFNFVGSGGKHCPCLDCPPGKLFLPIVST